MTPPRSLCPDCSFDPQDYGRLDARVDALEDRVDRIEAANAKAHEASASTRRELAKGVVLMLLGALLSTAGGAIARALHVAPPAQTIIQAPK